MSEKKKEGEKKWSDEMRNDESGGYLHYSRLCLLSTNRELTSPTAVDTTEHKLAKRIGRTGGKRKSENCAKPADILPSQATKPKFL